MDNAFTRLLLGKKTIIFSDGSTADVDVEFVMYGDKQSLVGLVDSNGQIFNWNFISVIKPLTNESN